MIRKILNKLLRPRHFWRHITFSELSELYISAFFRTLALSAVTIFIPIFLYGLQFSLIEIFGFYVIYFTSRAVFHVATAFIIARIGPKHTILISYIFQIMTALLLLTLPDLRWPLPLIAVVWALSNTLYFTAYHVDFSKIKHPETSGKEMGIIAMLQRAGGVAGPIVGGLVASVFGAQYIFLVMCVLLLAGLVPLLATAEPVKTRQSVSFKNLPLSKIKRDMASYVGLTINHQLSITLWPLYLGLFALGANVYLQLGILSSVGFLVSIFTAYSIGKLVDKKRGRQLLRITAVTDVFIQLARPFVRSLPFAFAVNTAGESTGTSLRIAYQKGMYDAADDLPGNRIVYISMLEGVGALSKALVWVVLIMVGVFVSFEAATVVGFAVAALASLLITAEKFHW